MFVVQIKRDEMFSLLINTGSLAVSKTWLRDSLVLFFLFYCHHHVRSKLGLFLLLVCTCILVSTKTPNTFFSLLATVERDLKKMHSIVNHKSTKFLQHTQSILLYCSNLQYLDYRVSVLSPTLIAETEEKRLEKE